jgi:hypothetical protein
VRNGTDKKSNQTSARFDTSLQFVFFHTCFKNVNLGRYMGAQLIPSKGIGTLKALFAFAAVDLYNERSWLNCMTAYVRGDVNKQLCKRKSIAQSTH